ncbi:MAG: glycosyltransferase family 2 protein [Candidatus Omnitrophica bacterium]|nr:glycosyltransferase family 2 protein [Candidatus Omnitrophota bacterium]
MQISTIIPTYNRARVLSRAIQSVLMQTGPALEVLVVDDGSTDETGLLVPRITQGDSRVRYFREANQGPSAARNLGVREAHGGFIAFLDSDDEWLPGKLKAQIEFFDVHPEHLICQTEEIWIRNGKRVNPRKKHKKYGGLIFEQCLPLSIVSPSCVMMRKTFFDQVGLFDESLPACEDYDLWLRASARFPIGLIEKPYVIKYGGASDQRSREFPVIDRFRIQALLKLLNSGVLSGEQKELTTRELIRKCAIVSQGGRKRGKIEEVRYYEELIKEYETYVIVR